MKTLHLVFAVLIAIGVFAEQPNELQDFADLKKLVTYMEGSYSSEEQAKSDTNYFHITLEMKQIWENSTNGAWLYVEQTAAWKPGEPYRQRIYHLEQQSDSTFTSTIYSMPNPKDFVGGHLKPEMFKVLSVDSVEVLAGCTLSLTYRKGSFSGSTIEGACLNSWGEASYATSEVEIFREHMYSWDRGWNDSREQVWGAKTSGYTFMKVSPTQ